LTLTKIPSERARSTSAATKIAMAMELSEPPLELPDDDEVVEEELLGDGEVVEEELPDNDEVVEEELLGNDEVVEEELLGDGV
jgi:hypothetical protein